MSSIKDKVWKEYKLVGLNPHNYGIDNSSAVGLWDFEAESLIDAAIQSPSGNIVNFGAFQGGSDVIFGLVQKYKGGGKVISVDIHHGKPWYRHVYRRARLDDVVIPLDQSSWEYMHDKSDISLVFSDSWHSYKTIMCEFDSINNYMKDGSIYAIHDCEPDVYDNIESYKTKYKIYHDSWMTEGEDEASVDSNQVKEYHQAEKRQNFEHGAAVAWILDHFPAYHLAKFGPTHYTPMLDVAGEWERGKTSPYNSLVFLQRV